ncbi:MAG: hypothetical protein LJE61_10385 [Thiocapsa sp.]|nr:hypothetical protein [Thiocapsa sp.]MCG6898227.1 hypothetical protein [Thiocapsa sp.]MCG6985586.1 hypothetical protein [Thiocapsa sp.]
MNRVRIGFGFREQPTWKLLLGIPLIYLPLLTTVPFLILGVALARLHLRMVGGTEIRGYWDFVPSWISHRYRNADHISFQGGTGRWMILRSRYFWILNCKLYCPMSVALLAYASYLVKVVENWWCPFAHDRKETYAEGAIDMSFWHAYPRELPKLHPEDRDNPIWNEAASRAES